MKALRDTHAFLWALIGPSNLSPKTRQLLQDERTDVVVSAASTWEIATKVRLDKLRRAKRVVTDYLQALQGLQASQLKFTSEQAVKTNSCNVAHRDPFDRMLAAQSQLDQLPLISSDPAMNQFGIEVIW